VSDQPPDYVLQAVAIGKAAGEPWCLFDHHSADSCEYCVKGVRVEFVKIVSEALKSAAVKSEIAKVEAEVERLRALGWTKADFARALKELLESMP
jgi:hypothetical protein